MKRILCILLCLTVIFIQAGCSSSNTNTKKGDTIDEPNLEVFNQSGVEVTFDRLYMLEEELVFEFSYKSEYDGKLYPLLTNFKINSISMRNLGVSEIKSSNGIWKKGDVQFEKGENAKCFAYLSSEKIKEYFIKDIASVDFTFGIMNSNRDNLVEGNPYHLTIIDDYDPFAGMDKFKFDNYTVYINECLYDDEDAFNEGYKVNGFVELRDGYKFKHGSVRLTINNDENKYIDGASLFVDLKGNVDRFNFSFSKEDLNTLKEKYGFDEITTISLYVSFLDYDSNLDKNEIDLSLD